MPSNIYLRKTKESDVSLKSKSNGKNKLPYHRYDLYEASVQDPESEIEFFARVYKENIKKNARVLREDFCATFRNACQWVKAGAKHEALAIDLSQETLDYGLQRLSHLTEAEQQRLKVLCEDVMSVTTFPADIISVSNFSIGYMKSREQLLKYFKHALNGLGEKGVFVCDLLGGQEMSVPQEDKRSFKMPDGQKIKYIWDHDDFNPITNEATFYIHYKIKGMPRFKRVFEYHWRMWGISELRDCLLEAGFDDVQVYWEEDDEDTGEGSDHYSIHKDAEDCPVWIAYVVGVKK